MPFCWVSCCHVVSLQSPVNKAVNILVCRTGWHLVSSCLWSLRHGGRGSLRWKINSRHYQYAPGGIVHFFFLAEVPQSATPDQDLIRPQWRCHPQSIEFSPLNYKWLPTHHNCQQIQTAGSASKMGSKCCILTLVPHQSSPPSTFISHGLPLQHQWGWWVAEQPIMIFCTSYK